MRSSTNLILAFLSEDENTMNLKEIGSTNKFDIDKPIQDYAIPGKYKLYKIPDELLSLTRHIKPNLMFKLNPYER